jgi:predicted porin
MSDKNRTDIAMGCDVAFKPTMRAEKEKKMKRMLVYTVIAMAIVSFGVVNAATIYKKDGLSYKISGDWQIQLRQDPGEDQDLDVEYDDLEIKNNIKYDLGNDLSAFGQLDFGFKNAADKSDEDANPHLEEAYLGFSYKGINIYMGKTDNASDDFGIEGAYEEPISDNAFDEAGLLKGDDIVAVSANFGSGEKSLYIVATHEIEAESEKSAGNGTFTDISAELTFSNLTIGAAYQMYEASGSDDEKNIYGVSLAYDAGFAEFAADYSIAEDELDFWNIFVNVPVEIINTTFGLGCQLLESDDSAEDDISAWYFNATYNFPAQKNVSVIAEIADTDEEDVDMGYLIGIRIKF